MFLPVILVREFGLAGWVVFAIPNIVGAAALPFVLRTPGASERYVARHAGAMQWFSAVTIAFHAMFLTWVASSALRNAARFADFGVRAPLGVGAASALGVVACGWFLGRFSVSRLSATAVGLWFASLALIGAALALDSRGAPPPGPAPAARPVDLALAAPVIAFGFALCPYLDLTFHRVCRDSSEAVARRAFPIGFGVCFLAMIAGSLAYTRLVGSNGAPMWPLLAHFAFQSAFTVGAHARELRAQAGPDAARWVVGPALVGVLVALLPHVAWSGPIHLTSERVYLCFLGFYAVAFPAYVWIMARVRDRAPIAPDAPGTPAFPLPSKAIWAATTLLTAPMLWLGFIEHRWFWLAPAAVLAVLSRPIALAIVRAKSPR